MTESEPVDGLQVQVNVLLGLSTALSSVLPSAPRELVRGIEYSITVINGTIVELVKLRDSDQREV